MIQLISPFVVVYNTTPPPTVTNAIDEFGSGNAIYIPPTPIQRDGTINYVNPNAGVVLR